MLNFQDLPDELVLKILSYSKTKDLISCGQVSKRIRRISHDSILWVTANLKNKIVKTELLEMILRKGCKILNLRNSMILGNLSSNIKSQLRVLKFSRPQFNIHCECDGDGDCNCAPDCNENTAGVLEELLFSCCSLQHLVMEGVLLTPKMAKSICKNGKTLQILNLNFSDLDEPILKEIIPSCQELKEVDLDYVNYGEGIEYADLEFLAENITPNVEKLNLSSISQDPEGEFNDYCFEILLRRCNKIKMLSLEATYTTDYSLSNIKQCLNRTLEELSLGPCDEISYSGFLELKSMPRLKILNLHYNEDVDQDILKEDIQDLRKLLPHMMINVSHE